MMERRLTWLAAFIALWGVAIFQKLVWLQIVHHSQYVQMARARQEITVQIPAPRGAIFDRTGATLAMSVPSESVFVNPLKVPDISVASEMLALALHMDRADLFARMQEAHDNKRGYFVVKRKLSFDEGQRLRELHQDWIAIQGQSERHYPGGKLAAHVLGSVDFSEKGNDGIERTMDATLQGEAGNFHLVTDVKRRGIDYEAGLDAKPGTPITLTIDERLQFIAEQEIERAVTAHHAESGSVVAMNPYTGEILAMASYPTFDPNQKPKAGDDPRARFNHAISVPFEPGSVFKTITLTAALETTKLTPDSPINCHFGLLTLFGHTIHDSEVGKWGILPMAMVLAHSSNVGAIEVGLTVGKDNMYDYVRRFGFHQRTGIPLPGESRGQLRDIDHWSAASLPSISMGQEISVTTLQLARAASVFANGGLLVTPRLILKQGNQAPPMVPPVRIIKPETAITMRKMMEGVVLYGTGKTVAKLDGYTSGGKTGTAQIYSQAMHRFSHDYNGSFMGFAPVTNPAIVVVATVNGTHGIGGFAAHSAGPVFRAVATEAMRILDVPRDLIDDTETTAVAAKTSTDDDADLADVSLAADGPNILDDPEDGDNSAPNAPRAPNFRGMTMRAVLAAAAAQGLTVAPDGSGVARLQIPPPGAVLHPGERIRVMFRR